MYHLCILADAFFKRVLSVVNLYYIFLQKTLCRTFLLLSSKTKNGLVRRSILLNSDVSKGDANMGIS